MIVGECVFDQHRWSAAPFGSIGLDSDRALRARKPELARVCQRARRLHAPVHLIGAQAVSSAVDAHGQLVDGVSGKRFELPPRDRNNAARPAHPEISTMVFSDKVDFVAGKSIARSELRQLAVFEEKETCASGADPD